MGKNLQKHVDFYILHQALFLVNVKTKYRQASNTRRTLVDQSDVVGASPVGAAPTTSSFST